ncbi:MAG: rhomboid family intramembrane serine protease [bacterium]
MFPYADDTPSYSFPFWIVVLVVLNIAVFIHTFNSDFDTFYKYGTVPARFKNAEAQISIPTHDFNVQVAPLDTSNWPSPFLTLITSIFLHGGFFHILGNMWFLWLFGDNVEDRMGKVIFPIFYILCGIISGLIHVIATINTSGAVLPAIGASGAIAGVMGAYIYMFPRATIATLWGFFLYFTTIHIPASIYLGFWFILQLLGGFSGGEASNIAFFAHIGGFVAGLVIAMMLSAMGLINRYPGDRGFKDFPKGPSIISHAQYVPPRRKRYTWHE